MDKIKSTGIERKLKTLRHYQTSIGENVKIKEYSTKTFKTYIQCLSRFLFKEKSRVKETIKLFYNIGEDCFFQEIHDIYSLSGAPGNVSFYFRSHTAFCQVLCYCSQ